MIVTKSRRMTVRMGRYEGFVIEGTWSVDTQTDEDVKGFEDYQVTEYLNSALDDLLAADISEAQACLAEGEDSWIKYYKQPDEDNARPNEEH